MGGVYDTAGRLSSRAESCSVPSCGSLIVGMIAPEPSSPLFSSENFIPVNNLETALRNENNHSFP